MTIHLAAHSVQLANRAPSRLTTTRSPTLNFGSRATA